MKRFRILIMACIFVASFFGCEKQFVTDYGTINFRITPEIVLKIYELVTSRDDFQSAIIETNGLKIGISGKEQYVDLWGNADFCLNSSEVIKLKLLLDKFPEDFYFRNKLGTLILIDKKGKTQ